MAHTYQNLLPSLSATLKDVVSKVSLAISNEIGMTVKYKHNGFTALMNELTLEKEVDTIKNDRYPLIGLIQPFRGSWSNGIYKVRFDLIICTLTEATKPADKRETDSYNAILRPIYAELLSQIRKHPNIEFKGNEPAHDVVDIYHMGDSRGGTNGYILPDTVDAIVIEGMEFSVSSSYECNNDCVPIHEVDFLAYIKEATLTVSESNITVRLVDATTDSYSVLFDATDTPITVGGSVSLTASHDGIYVIQIAGDNGQTVQMEVVKQGGIITTYTKKVSQTFSYNLDCANYFYYPYIITFRYETTDVKPIKTSNISDAAGNIQTYFTDNDLPLTYQDGTIHELANNVVVNVITGSNSNQLENKTILYIKTI